MELIFVRIKSKIDCDFLFIHQVLLFSATPNKSLLNCVSLTISTSTHFVHIKAYVKKLVSVYTQCITYTTSATIKQLHDAVIFMFINYEQKS